MCCVGNLYDPSSMTIVKAHDSNGENEISVFRYDVHFARLEVKETFD